MELIDTHLHLIYRDRLGYGWTGDVPALSRGDFTIADHADLTRGAGIVGSLFMETGVDDPDYQAETRFVAGLVGQGGLLGQIASCRPETDAGFDAWLDECAGFHVKGFRRILHVVPDALSQSDSFRRNLRKIGARGLTFDICMRADQLSLARDLARVCDDQVLVLDHCGVPDIKGGAFARWADGIAALAELPHVVVKLSGVAAYCAPGTVTATTLRPWCNHIIDCFSPARIVWGSDWPVVNTTSDLPTWIAITQSLLEGLSETERSAIGTGNARTVYRLSPPQ
jgi:predicted TIM-barrel fold metal-dependent hydrolase